MHVCVCMGVIPYFSFWFKTTAHFVWIKQMVEERWYTLQEKKKEKKEKEKEQKNDNSH